LCHRLEVEVGTSGVLVVSKSEWDGGVRERFSEIRVANVEALSYTLDKYLDGLRTNIVQVSVHGV